MRQSCRSDIGLAPNHGLIRLKYPRAGNTPFKNDFCNKIGSKRRFAALPQYVCNLGLNRKCRERARNSAADSSSEENTRAVSSMFRVGRFVQQGVENLVGRCVVVALARP